MIAQVQALEVDIRAHVPDRASVPEHALEATPGLSHVGGTLGGGGEGYLHGSFLEGGPARDMDLAVWVRPDWQRGSWRRYELDLSTDLQLLLRHPVDVRVLNDAPLAFRYHALKGRPLLVRDRDALDEVRARTWDEYFDFLPFAREHLREVLSA